MASDGSGKASGSGGDGTYKVIASASPYLSGGSSVTTSKAASVKRTLEKDTASSSDGVKRAHVVPAKPAQEQWASLFGRSKDGPLQWKKSLGHDSCLRAEYGKPFERELEARKKADKRAPVRVACFDLDGCIVRPKGGKIWPSPTNADDYEQVFPGNFAAVRRAYEEGACIAILTNQDQSSAKSSRRLDVWRVKMERIARAIDVPMLILAAIAKDGYRKPGRLMWDHGVVGAYIQAGGCREDIDVTTGLSTVEQSSFFVGDAAGRVGDHADTDRKWAINLGLPFYTPEEYFLGKEPQVHRLTGWQPTLEGTMQGDENVLPSNFFAPSKSDTLDLVVFVGSPASGKTTFYRKHFAHHGVHDYAWVNQDTLKSAAKCHAETRRHLTEGRSVVIDNTNRNRATRARYIDLAREVGNVSVRCIFFDVPQELSWHNNLFRVRAGLQSPDEHRVLVPKVAFNTYYSGLERPTRKEGFDVDVVVVKWSFSGGEEAKRRWLLQWE